MLIAFKDEKMLQSKESNNEENKYEDVYHVSS